MAPKKAIVVGGGFAGFSAGYRLRKPGGNLRYIRIRVVQLGYRKLPNTNVVSVLIPAAGKPRSGCCGLRTTENPDRAPVGHSLLIDRFFTADGPRKISLRISSGDALRHIRI